MKLIKLLSVVFFGFLFVSAFKIYKLTRYFSQKGRVNVLVYDSTPIFLSLNVREGVNYYANLPLDIKVKVPGGHGYFRIGSLGKLAFLEKTPGLLGRTFSLFFSTPVDFYFYKDISQIYYSNKGKVNNLRAFEIHKLFSYSSNADLLTRIYLFLKLFDFKNSNFELLKVRKEEVEEDRVDLEKFHRRLQGFFYSTSLRQEDKKVKIYFSVYPFAAKNIGRILEGTGVNVIGFQRREKLDKCEVEAAQNSFTLEFLTRAFKCNIKINSKLSGNLIKFYLDKSLEEQWK